MKYNLFNWLCRGALFLVFLIIISIFVVAAIKIDVIMMNNDQVRRVEQRRDPGQQHGGRGRGGESSRHPGNSGPFERGVRGGAGDGTFEKPISEVWILHWKPEIGNWNVYPDDVKFAKHVFRENNIATYFIMPPQNRRKTHLFSTLNARNNMMTGKFS